MIPSQFGDGWLNQQHWTRKSPSIFGTENHYEANCHSILGGGVFPMTTTSITGTKLSFKQSIGVTMFGLFGVDTWIHWHPKATPRPPLHWRPAILRHSVAWRIHLMPWGREEMEGKGMHQWTMGTWTGKSTAVSPKGVDLPHQSDKKHRKSSHLRYPHLPSRPWRWYIYIHIYV